MVLLLLQIVSLAVDLIWINNKSGDDLENLGDKIWFLGLFTLNALIQISQFIVMLYIYDILERITQLQIDDYLRR